MQEQGLERRRCVAALAGAACAGAARAKGGDSTVAVPPAHDTSIFNGTVGSETLSDGAGAHLWLAVTASGLNRRALLRFDLSAVPRGSVVRQVSLTLWQSMARAQHDVALHRLLAAWGEGASDGGSQGTGAPAQPGDATWTQRVYPSTPWAQPGADHDPVQSATQTVGLASGAYSWAGARGAEGSPVPRIVADVQRWVDQPADNHGWLVIGDESGLQNAKRFDSRSHPNPANRPRLSVVYGPPNVAAHDADVPVPGWAAALLAGALAAGAWRARRR